MTLIVWKINEDGAKCVEAIFEGETEQQLNDIVESWLHGQPIDKFEITLD